MSIKILTDQEISNLISELKIVPDNWTLRLIPKDKSNYQHKEKEIDVEGASSNLFRVIVRQSKQNILDFSIILILREKDSNIEYTLIRYNGRHSSVHTNKWEKERGLTNSEFEPNFHIHKATQRYQESGYKIDGYAEVTAKFSDFQSALQCFLKDCNFKNEDDKQPSLFAGGNDL